MLLDYEIVNDRLEKLVLGRVSWIGSVKKDGRIHGKVHTLGTVSRRCSHSSPNIAQVPAVYTLYGKECRELFIAPEDCVMVGCDASGLELRCLAHYLHPYDNGKFALEVVSGDIHSRNAKAFGCDRDLAKTLIYAILYGSGVKKLAKIAETDVKEVKKMQDSFFKATPAFEVLLSKVRYRASKYKRLFAIDKGILYIRSVHSALNLLLQSCGAIVMKEATVVLFNNLQKEKGYEFGKEYRFVASVHDEMQLVCFPELAEEIGREAVNSIKQAGINLKMKVQLDGEYKIGKNWAETH